MGSGLLRELQGYTRFVFFFWGGGLRDGSGCGNLLGTKTHGLGSIKRNCRKLAHTNAILQAQNAIRNIELLTVSHSGTPVFRIRRQLNILGPQELAFADSCTFLIGGGNPDHRLMLSA